MRIDEQIIFYNQYWDGLPKFGSYKLKRLAEILKLLDYVKKEHKHPKILDLDFALKNILKE